MPETGRKFWITLAGMVFAMVRPDAAPYIATMAVAFCGGNAVISVAHSKSDATSRHLTGQSDVERRPNIYRDDERGE